MAGDHNRAVKRILVVDDDDDVRVGLVRALSLQDGLEVTAARDGFEAGFFFGVFRPQLVILDMVMPGMDGLDVCARIRHFSDEDGVKIIVLTGYPGCGSNEHSIIAGADLYLTKPQDVSTLVTHIEDLLGE